MSFLFHISTTVFQALTVQTRYGKYTGARVYGGALSAVRVQCARSATIWASGRTRDPYFEILGAPRGIMVIPSGGFDF